MHGWHEGASIGNTAGGGDPGGGNPGGGNTAGGAGEFAVIAAVTAGRAQPPSTILGPGDDAAVLRAADGRVVATTDMLVQGVHFRLDWSKPEHVGRKAIAVNLADIAAMGAAPTSVLVALGCPPQTPTSVLTELAEGMWAEADRAGVGIAGGDMVAAEQLVLSVTALGDLAGREPIRRDGALPGDVLAVRGRLGWAAGGLAVLGRGFRSPAPLVNAHRWPEPPYAAGPAAAEAGASAMIDVSDGLLADLGHIATASGVRFDLDTTLLTVDERLAEIASALGADPLRWVLTGGEDHALAATFRAAEAIPEGWTRIGRAFARGGSAEAVTVDGHRYEAQDAGWQHWRR